MSTNCARPSMPFACCPALRAFVFADPDVDRRRDRDQGPSHERAAGHYQRGALQPGPGGDHLHESVHCGANECDLGGRHQRSEKRGEVKVSGVARHPPFRASPVPLRSGERHRRRSRRWRASRERPAAPPRGRRDGVSQCATAWHRRRRHPARSCVRCAVNSCRTASATGDPSCAKLASPARSARSRAARSSRPTGSSSCRSSARRSGLSVSP